MKIPNRPYPFPTSVLSRIGSVKDFRFAKHITVRIDNAKLPTMGVREEYDKRTAIRADDRMDFGWRNAHDIILSNRRRERKRKPPLESSERGR